MTKQSDEYFQKQEVKDVLLSRAKNKSESVCISGEDVDGVHYRYTSEYLRWNIERKLVTATVNLTDEQRKQWFLDNPAPKNKFKENPHDNS